MRRITWLAGTIGIFLLGLGSSAQAQYTQQAKLVGSGALGGGGVNGACQGSSVSISADGNTAVVGGPCDNNFSGAFWIFKRSAGVWSQEGNKMLTNQSNGQQGVTAISGDGNTIIEAGTGNTASALNGGAWIFIRNSNGTWSQQGGTLVPNDTDDPPGFGTSIAISSDGNTAIVGGTGDGGGTGAAWIFTRTGGQWTQQGPKLTGNDASATGIAATFGILQGVSVGISADGNTAIVGGNYDNNQIGAAWIYVRGSDGTWSQQGPKLTAHDATGNPQQGRSVAISGDGNTAAVGGFLEPNLGAAWIYTRTNGTWSQQGPQIVGTGASGNPLQGTSVALSQDGGTLLSGGNGDANGVGAAWVFTRANGAWTQKGNKLVGSGAVGRSSQGDAVALSADGSTAIVGGSNDNNAAGAAWVFGPAAPAATHFSVSAPSSASAGAAFNVTVTALDANNNTFGAYGGTVHFTSSDASAALPADATLSSGVRTFQATLHTAGSQTITATDTATSSLTGTSGAITVTTAAGMPTAGGDSVGSGSGTSTTMAFTFSDSAGFLNLHVVDVLINNALDGRHACYIAFVPSGANSGALDLVDDAGDAGGPYSGTTLPGSGTVGNSQCTVGGSASGSGNTLTLTLNITFSSSFSGDKVIYLSAGDASGANSNWQALATWNVPGGAVSGPSVTGMSPARTNSLGTTVYTFTFADTGGFQDANSVENILVNSAIDGRHACFLAFVASSNSVLLVDDAGDAAGPYQGLVLPSGGSISNSQCTINGTGSSVSRNGNSLTLTLSITFSPSFAGNQVFYLAARNSTGNSNWQAAGSVSVP
ncbi:exported hypothetical protein [Candidatus Sulfopaludibacter sp. SbA4]|nr:exported hypothetical protein [Candidatus Sulfopaludibacter sp. SbA4]